MSADQIAGLLELAGTQHGVVTTEQASAVGLSTQQITRLVAAGVLARGDLGIVRVAGWPDSWAQQLTATVLRAGPGAVVSHRGAARWWEVEGFDRAPVELSVPRGSRQRPRRGIVHRVRDLERSDLVRRRGLWVTSPARTIVDLGGVVDDELVEVAVDDLLRRRLTTLEKIGEVAERLGRPGRSGPPVAQGLLAVRARLDGLTESGFETRLLRILREAGLPDPVLQYEVLDDEGRFVMRLDAAYPDEMVGIEADSERWHSDRRRFVADRTKRSAAESLGWRILAVTHRHVVAERGFVADTVTRTLAVARRAAPATSGPSSVR
jgi:hypothetical protein